MPNRLAESTSPYLLQHADNPVDWWPWGPEALAEAERRQVPIFLSVGYAACHWCHVMAHESFEDPDVAAVINSDFVAIKVDREERPDVDAVYMQATQALTGQGGWPMSVFLTPDGKPFHAGTYFPPRPAHGMPSFPQVLAAVTAAWQDRTDEVRASAAQIRDRLAELGAPSRGPAVTDADITAGLTGLIQEFDPVHAGFGGAPKFPPSMVLDALLRVVDPPMAERSVDMAVETLAAMAGGGIHDQLGGGFARYSVDAGWVVPHFEKMLYDNALLLGSYVEALRRGVTGPYRDLFVRTVTGIVDWLVREMRTAEGGFAASLDADSLDADGRLTEGAFYVWRPDQLAAVLGEEDARWAAEVFSVTRDGTFEHGLSTLQLRADPEDPERFARVREALFAARDRRARPALDDKVVAAWNGWLVDALVGAGQVLDRPDWIGLARDAAEHLWRVHWVNGRLRRSSRGGRVADAPGIAEDHGAFAAALLQLATVEEPTVWLDRARAVLAVVDAQFLGSEGEVYDVAADAAELINRPCDPADNATPSGLSSLIRAWRQMAELTGEPEWHERADRALRGGSRLVSGAPRFSGWQLADAVSQSLVRQGRGPVQLAIAGSPEDPHTAELLAAGRRHVPAGSVVVAGMPDQPGVPLLADRPMVEGRPTAYVCRQMVCRLPVTEVADLVAELRNQAAR